MCPILSLELVFSFINTNVFVHAMRGQFTKYFSEKSFRSLGSHDHYPEFLDVSRVLLILGYLDRLCDPIDVEVETFCRTRDVRRPGPINLSVGVTIKDPGMQ